VSGAREVLAVDINPLAIACAMDNVKLNHVEDVVAVLVSDLFEKIPPGRKFDLIIANLPITDLPIKGVIESALYDSHMKILKRLFHEAANHLSPGGVLVMTHADFLGRDDFRIFEDLLHRYGLKAVNYIEIQDLSYAWRMYRIVVA
jgi:release factor glutamine methyltransferase